MLLFASPIQRLLIRCVIIASACAILGFPGAASARTETLRWQQTDMTNVAGFNVYVGTSPGNYGSPLDVGMATLEGGDIYTYDLEVPGNGTVYVVVTAYSASGEESVDSNWRAFGDNPGFPAVLPIILDIILD